MLYSLVKEMLTSHLQQLSSLTNMYRRQDANWLNSAEIWLEEAEGLMGRFRFAEGGLIAVARGSIAKANDAVYPEGKNRRKQIVSASRAAAHNALEEAARLMSVRVSQAEERLQAFEDKLCEGMTAYMLENPETLNYVFTKPANLWTALKSNSATTALILYAEASIGMQDRMYLLENIMARIKCDYNNLEMVP